MNNRRTFIKQAGVLTLGTLVIPDAWAKSKNVGLQLYSVKEEMDKDALGTLKKLAAIGYKEIESFAGSKGIYWGMTGKELQARIRDMGMNLRSTHFGGSEHMKEGDFWKKTVDEAAEADVKYLVASYLDPTLSKSIDGFHRAAAVFNTAGEMSSKSGVQLTYHNHADGFQKMDDKLPYDILLTETNSAYFNMEMDIYWLVKAGGDPAAYFNKYPGRFPLLHVKDMDKVNREINSDLGKGMIDFVSLFKLAKKAGVKYPFIEQENFTGDYYASLKVDYDYMKKISY